MFGLFKRYKEPAPQSGDELSAVERDLRRMGYALTTGGAEMARRLLYKEYSASETASTIAVITLAQDTRKSIGAGSLDREIFCRQGRAILLTMESARNQGNIGARVWEDASSAIREIMRSDSCCERCMERVLHDPAVADKRLATHWLDDI